jgi:hypothetical protein
VPTRILTIPPGVAARQAAISAANTGC